ncbi:MAG: hypothetical protein H6585_05245 [Flavobacteriales bacterium]|nr:transglutaminase family protein [Flavobacteriales bacterium]MCB9447734.1 hypothetical protein [Flavobacteriales bacterium]
MMQSVDALIQLLDDPDEGVFSHIESVLRGYGTAVLPQLSAAQDGSRDKLLKHRISNLLKRIYQGEASQLLQDWVISDHRNLLKGAHLVSQIAAQDADYDKLSDRFNRLTRDVWIEFNENLTALEKVRVLNYILFDVHGFSVTQPPFHAPEEHCIHRTLKRKSGSPVVLSILYASLASKLGMPVHTISLPGQFILAYMDGESFIPTKTKSTDVLFYINVFHKGTVFSAREIKKYLRKMNVKPDPSHFYPGSNIQAIQQLLRSLEFSFETTGRQDEAMLVKNARENMLIPVPSGGMS